MMRRNTEQCKEQRKFQCVQCNSKRVMARQPESRQTQAPSRHITTASRLRKPFRHTIWPLQRQIQLQRHPKEGKPPKTQSSTIKPRPITQGARPPTAATILPTSPLGAATSSPNRRQNVGKIPAATPVSDTAVVPSPSNPLPSPWPTKCRCKCTTPTSATPTTIVKATMWLPASRTHTGPSLMQAFVQGSAKRQGLGCVNSLPGSAWL